MYLYTAAAVVALWGRQVLGFVLAFEFSTPCPEAVGLRAMGYKNNMTPNSKAYEISNLKPVGCLLKGMFARGECNSIAPLVSCVPNTCSSPNLSCTSRNRQ